MALAYRRRSDSRLWSTVRMTDTPELIIVSGLSGSGKTVALHTLEDLGYYCIDNLPVALLPGLGAHLRQIDPGRQPRFAVGIDARSHPSQPERFERIEEALAGHGLNVKVLFLTADDATLIQRFSETRRRHPLTGKERSLAEAIARERVLLAPLLERADMLIDTRRTTLHQLRELISERLGDQSAALSVLFQSFGFKHGVPGDADFVYDVRCLPNPHWEPGLRPLTGRDAAVIAYLESHPSVLRMRDDIRQFLEAWLPAFRSGYRSYLTIAIGCTGGQHRSVYLVEQLADAFSDGTLNVARRHRELI